MREEHVMVLREFKIFAKVSLDDEWILYKSGNDEHGVTPNFEPYVETCETKIEFWINHCVKFGKSRIFKSTISTFRHTTTKELIEEKTTDIDYTK